MYHLSPEASHSLREYLRDARTERLIQRRYFTPNPLAPITTVATVRRITPRPVPNLPYKSDAGSLR